MSNIKQRRQVRAFGKHFAQSVFINLCPRSRNDGEKSLDYIIELGKTEKLL